ncbi:uncharacterized protein EDB91DRAFT_1088449 [Suillus paluster]|uniref:uncharacterized protein n=1 Tax=Suillus paluster TaxID=48578 RepID=UPI001B8775AF|nr:uncharacterized protein EDB91DRAFT_1088449 [Suillus paluster]KAG1721485.1 hypothetical protein EDB91DRAFT_1088449 [Suillus paluster]
MTKGIKQIHAEDTIGHMPAKGKRKEKAKEVTEPIRGHQLAKADAEAKTYNPPCKRCVDEPCLVILSKRGQVMRSCSKCSLMKVKCDRPMSVDSNTPAPAQQALMAHLRSRAAPASKKVPLMATLRSESNVPPRRTRATSRARPPTPILESEEKAVKGTNVSITGNDDADMEPNADAERHSNINTEILVEPTADDNIIINEPRAITSVDDFPADHWLSPNLMTSSFRHQLLQLEKFPFLRHLSHQLSALVSTSDNHIQYVREARAVNW